jgi:hypothetical protein
MIGWMTRKYDEEGRLWQMSMDLDWIDYRNDSRKSDMVIQNARKHELSTYHPNRVKI